MLEVITNIKQFDIAITGGQSGSGKLESFHINKLFNEKVWFFFRNVPCPSFSRFFSWLLRKSTMKWSKHIWQSQGFCFFTKDRGNVGGSLVNADKEYRLVTFPLVLEQRRLHRVGNSQFLQVVHEDLEADVVCEDGSSCLLQSQKKNASQSLYSLFCDAAPTTWSLYCTSLHKLELFR